MISQRILRHFQSKSGVKYHQMFWQNHVHSELKINAKSNAQAEDEEYSDRAKLIKIYSHLLPNLVKPLKNFRPRLKQAFLVLPHSEIYHLRICIKILV